MHLLVILVNPLQVLLIGAHQNTAPVVRIWAALYISGLFQPIKHHCHATGGETGTLGEPPRRNWSYELQDVNTLHVRQFQAGTFRNPLIKQNYARNKLPDLAY
jgi:hypothetical protein